MRIGHFGRECRWISLKTQVLFVPVLLWYAVFSLLPLVPHRVRPQIDVITLPSLEIHFFGDLPYQWLSRYTSVLADIIAAIVYTIHPFVPFLHIIILYKKKQNGKIPLYILCFGLTSLLGLMTHIFFPTAPPWWYDMYGFKEASYEQHGDPAGLHRVDYILGMNIYHRTYEMSPVVFGAFPSLHVAWPFLGFVFRPFLGKWTLIHTHLVVLAAIYLRHHFFLDTAGGCLYPLIVCYIVRKLSEKYERNILPC